MADDAEYMNDEAECNDAAVDALLAVKSRVDDALAKLTTWSEEHFDLMPDTVTEQDVRRIRRVLIALRTAMIAERID